MPLSGDAITLEGFKRSHLWTEGVSMVWIIYAHHNTRKQLLCTILLFHTLFISFHLIHWASYFFCCVMTGVLCSVLVCLFSSPIDIIIRPTGSTMINDQWSYMSVWFLLEMIIIRYFNFSEIQFFSFTYLLFNVIELLMRDEFGNNWNQWASLLGCIQDSMYVYPVQQATSKMSVLSGPVCFFTSVTLVILFNPFATSVSL